MNEQNLHQFMSFRSSFQPDDNSETPPNALCQALSAAGISFERVIYCLKSAEAVEDPETQSLYPDGPESGPEQVFLYYFATTEEHLPSARKIAFSLFP